MSRSCKLHRQGARTSPKSHSGADPARSSQFEVPAITPRPGSERRLLRPRASASAAARSRRTRLRSWTVIDPPTRTVTPEGDDERHPQLVGEGLAREVAEQRRLRRPDERPHASRRTRKRGYAIWPAPHDRLIAMRIPGRKRPTKTSAPPRRCTIRSAATRRSSPGEPGHLRRWAPRRRGRSSRRHESPSTAPAAPGQDHQRQVEVAVRGQHGGGDDGGLAGEDREDAVAGDHQQDRPVAVARPRPRASPERELEDRGGRRAAEDRPITARSGACARVSPRADDASGPRGAATEPTAILRAMGRIADAALSDCSPTAPRARTSRGACSASGATRSRDPGPR